MTINLFKRNKIELKYAVAIKDNKADQWEPVGEENLYGVVKEPNGYMIVICDKNGIAKSLANWFSEEEKNSIVSKIKSENAIEEYVGRLSLPV